MAEAVEPPRQPGGSGNAQELLSRLVLELRRRGYRVTAQRLAIAKIVFENIKKHPSFMEIVEEVRKSMPSISPSTIYNNLQLLEQLGFIRSFDIAGETRYDEAKPHINLVCLDTGKIIDIEDEEILRNVLRAASKYTRDIREVIIEARCGEPMGEGASGPG